MKKRIKIEHESGCFLTLEKTNDQYKLVVSDFRGPIAYEKTKYAQEMCCTYLTIDQLQELSNEIIKLLDEEKPKTLFDFFEAPKDEKGEYIKQSYEYDCRLNEKWNNPNPFN